MFPASSKGGGMAVASGPDVCKTPAPPAPAPVPIPYPNMGNLAQAIKTSTKVLFVGKEAITLKSEVPMSMGDEAGVAGGVVSGRNMDKILFKKGSSKVKVEGQDCVHLTSVTSHNGANANVPGVVAAPSQSKVLVAP